ncbi:MAG: FecR family protein, partial [Rhodospirillales bacterium]|nr:FecR family protein [Rhodospirillales bacterium]
MTSPPRDNTSSTPDSNGGNGPPIAEWIVRYHDDALSEKELALLREHLCKNETVRRLFVQWSFQQQLMRETLSPGLTSAAEQDAEALPTTEELLAEVIDQERAARIKREAEETLLRQQSEEEEKRRRASWARMMGIGENKPVDVHKRLIIPTPIFYGGIAALLAVALWIGWAAVSSMMQDEPQDFAETTPDPTDPQPPMVAGRPVVATLIRTLDAVWAERHIEVRAGEAHTSAPLEGGAELREGDSYKLLQGFAQLDTKRGAIVVLEAPCDIQLLDENHVKLTRGKLVGKCPTDESKGFIVDTPTARVVDVGTEFGVHVDDLGISEAHVFDGEIQLTAMADGKMSQPARQLVAGDAVQVNEAGTSVQPQQVSPLAFVRGEEFDARIKAGTSPYHRWLAHAYQLRRDPHLLLHFTFDNVSDQGVVYNEVESMSQLQGIFQSSNSFAPVKWREDRFGRRSAVEFDRTSHDMIEVTQWPRLGALNAISVCMWVHVD